MTENIDGEPHIILSNSEGKKWIFPINNVKTGIHIYQPSSRKGKMVKLVLPMVAAFPFLLKSLKIKVANMCLEKPVMMYLNDLLGNDIKYSVFSGTPSPNQKVTIQLNRGQACVAYAKISEKEHIKDFFQREYTLLKFLEKVNMPGVPRALGLHEIEDQTIFVQSGDKSGNEMEAENFDRVHFLFLEDMYKRTQVIKPFAETEYAGMLERLQKSRGHFRKAEEEIIQRSVEMVRDFFSSETRFCLYHGDFTPWNMYLKENALHVFDFEYAKWEYPLFLDVFHFHTQIWKLVQHKQKTEIWNMYRGLYREWQKDFGIKDADIFYTAYLLDIIYENISLEDKTGKKIDDSCYEIWLFLLEKLNAGRKTET